MDDYCKNNFPNDNEMFVLSTDLTGNERLQLGVMSNPSIKDPDKWEFIEGPVPSVNFWSRLPPISGFDDDPYFQLHNYFFYYHTQLCQERDVEVRSRLAWFLVYWCLNRRTINALQTLQNGGNVDEDVAVLMHAIRIIRSVVRTNGQNHASVWFHPFLGGEKGTFIDHPDDPTQWKETVRETKTLTKHRLELPSNSDDPLATVLRAHPNTFIIRLSPTRPMHLEFIRYVVEDVESGRGRTMQDRQARRKLQKYVMFYRMNMLNNPYFSESCDGGLIYTLYYMENLFFQQPGAAGIFHNYYYIPLFMLVTWMMKNKADIERQKAYFAPLITDRGSLASYTDCNQVQVPEMSWFQNYDLWVDTLETRKDGVSWLLYVFSSLPQADTRASLVVQFNNLRDTYREYLDADKYCNYLFPAMDNYGDPGCRVSETWMLDMPPMEFAINPLTERLLKYVDEEIYTGSLWECSNSWVGQIRRYAQAFARDHNFVDPENQERLTDSNAQRYLNLWHLVRWLGITFFKGVMTQGGSNPNPRNWTNTVKHLTMWMLRSGSVYPFATSQQADSMIDALGNLGQKHACVVRLSTSQVLGIEVRTPRANPRWNPELPYEPKYLSITIPVNVWAGVNSKAYENRGVWFTTVPKDWREVDFTMRYQLYQNYDKLVMVRNLGSIKVYLDSCGFNVDLRTRFWNFEKSEKFDWRGFGEIRHTFLRKTTEDALDDITPVVKKKFKRLQPIWNKIMSLTIRVNAPGEGMITASSSTLCRSGTYPRMDFSKGGNINTPDCTDKPLWMYKQPLLDTIKLQKLIQHYVKKKKDPQLLDDILRVWQALSSDRSLTAHWCNTGNRGNRNKTLLINWLGADCIKYIARSMRSSRNSLPWGQPLSIKTSAEKSCFLRFQTLGLLGDPGLSLFLSPPEAELFATRYPGYLQVSLSGTQPGYLSVRGYSNDDITTMIKDELDLNMFLDYMPHSEEDANSIPLGLMIRLVLFDTYGMHLPSITDPKKDDAVACGNRPTPSFQSLKDTLLNYYEHVEFKHPVNREYASRMTALLANASTKGSGNVEALPSFFTEEELRQLQVAPWLSQPRALVRNIQGYASLFANKVRQTASRLRAWAYAEQEWYTNPASYWYATNTIPAEKFQLIVQRLLAGKQDPETKVLSLGGFMGDVLSSNADLKPTDIPSLVRKIDSTGKGGLLSSAEKFQETEFQGEAAPEKKTSWLKSLKRKIFGEKRDASAARIGIDNQDILTASSIEGNETLVKSLLMQKKNADIPFGPEETKLAKTMGIIPTAPQPTKKKPSHEARTGVAPPPGVTHYEPAGPMTDVGGPPFQAIKDPRWSQYNTQGGLRADQYFTDLNDGFEETECRDNGPDYVYPAFAVDEKTGRVVARCGRPNWMMDEANYSRELLSKIDPENQKLLLAIRNMAKHWCPTVSHQIKLWRWLGVSCLGRLSLDFLGEEALREAEETTLENLNPVETLRRESMRDQLQMIQAYREEAEARRSGRTKSKQDRCKKRIIFLSQMISSNILFPYVRDAENARLLASEIPNKVVCMLSWSKSGQLICMMQSSRRSGRPLERKYMAEDLVNFSQYTPTVVRLKIFHDFYGGIAASNYLFYEKVLRSSQRGDCVQSLGAMKRYAIRAALPRSYQLQLDRIYQEVVRARGQVTEEQRRQLKEIQNISVMLQSKNLVSNELYLFEEILKLENDVTMKPDEVAELASRLYKARDVDVRVTEAEQFENLTICQRPEYVPYIRKKLKEKYPEMNVEDIEQMDRVQLCKALLNTPQLDQIDLPVPLWQITDFPPEFENSRTHLLALWDGSKEQEIDMWLMKNYGIRVRQLREWNKDYGNEEQLIARGEVLREKAMNKQKKEREEQELLMNFREFLLDGKRCKDFSAEHKTCEKLVFNTTDGKEVGLCDQGCSERETAISALDLLSMIFKNLCDPRVPLLMNDFEFILESYKTLMNYFLMMKLPRPKAERRLDKQCRLIQTMYTELMDAARPSGENLPWFDVPLATVLNQPGIKETVQNYFGGNLNSLTTAPLPTLWAALQRTNPTKKQITSFAFTVLLHIALVNQLVRIPKP